MMKKITAAILFSSLAFATTASASSAGGTTTAAVDTQLVTGYNAIGSVATNINIPRPHNILPIANRAGFIKSRFEIMLSANVIAGLNDDAATNRMIVIAGSNKGYNLFSGSSVGGSVSQCGQPVTKATANLAASLVVAGSQALTTDNGCNR